MRFRAHVDSNQAGIVADLRRMGCTVTSLAAVGKGCPDIMVGRNGRTYLYEIKNPETDRDHRRLTDHERQWHAMWKGHVRIAHSTAEIVEDINNVEAGKVVG